MEENSPTSLFELHIDASSSAHLNEAAKWAKFLAIVGFVFCGLIVLLAFFAGSLISLMIRQYGMETADGVSASAAAGGGAFLVFWYVLFAAIYFFPCLFLFRFASKMQVALRNNDQAYLGNSVRNLKACFRFVGILTIIWLSFCALGLIFFILGALR